MTLASLSGWLNLARAIVTEDTMRAILKEFCKKTRVYTTLYAQSLSAENRPQKELLPTLL